MEVLIVTANNGLPYVEVCMSYIHNHNFSIYFTLPALKKRVLIIFTLPALKKRVLIIFKQVLIISFHSLYPLLKSKFLSFHFTLPALKKQVLIISYHFVKEYQLRRLFQFLPHIPYTPVIWDGYGTFVLDVHNLLIQ